MALVLIDGREIEIDDRERLNGIQAAERAGVQIPHYCWHPGLSVVGSCRMCLVEAGTRDAKTGRITMFPKLVPACNTPVRDGTVLVTNSEKVAHARAMVEEDLLLRHPIDCPICDKAGECRLQDYHFQYGQDQRRADIRPFTSRRRDVGDNITLFVDRCVMCSRCVRFTREIAGTSELMVVNRGAHEEIDVVPGFPLANNLSGNVVDLCPVGALGDKDFLYRQRVWFLRKHAGVCTHCATGCSIWVEENQDRIYRLRPRENPHVNGWWICNEGRYGYPYVHSDRRLLGIAYRTPGEPRASASVSGEPRASARGLPNPGANAPGSPVAEVNAPGSPVAEVNAPGSLVLTQLTQTSLDWTTLVSELPDRLGRPGRLAAVLSPFLTVEEAYMLAKFVRRLDAQAVLAMGPIPTVGQDERFPSGFTISAEKCPNRRGVEEVVAHFMRRIPTFEELLAEIDGGQIRGVWVSGGYWTDWIDEPTARRFAGLEVLVVQDLFPSPLADLATYSLPGAAFAERDGSYVNRRDHLQSVRASIRPPSGVRPEGSLLWELLGMPGLYDARAVLSEVAAEILCFHVAANPIPETGIDLKLNLLAQATSPNA